MDIRLWKSRELETIFESEEKVANDFFAVFFRCGKTQILSTKAKFQAF
jgi:RNase P protein component